MGTCHIFPFIFSIYLLSFLFRYRYCSFIHVLKRSMYTRVWYPFYMWRKHTDSLCWCCIWNWYKAVWKLFVSSSHRFTFQDSGLTKGKFRKSKKTKQTNKTKSYLRNHHRGWSFGCLRPSPRYINTKQHSKMSNISKRNIFSKPKKLPLQERRWNKGNFNQY